MIGDGSGNMQFSFESQPIGAFIIPGKLAGTFGVSPGLTRSEFWAGTFFAALVADGQVFTDPKGDAEVRESMHVAMRLSEIWMEELQKFAKERSSAEIKPIIDTSR